MDDPASWRLVFPVDLKVGLVKRAPHVAVVTRDLLVLARISDARLQQGMALAIQQAKAQGQGYLAQMRSAANARYVLCEEYRTRDLDEIASETPGNPRIPCQLVEKVTWRAANAPMLDNDAPQATASDLLVKTRNDKLDMTFAHDAYEDAIVQGLRWVFGERFR